MVFCRQKNRILPAPRRTPKFERGSAFARADIPPATLDAPRRGKGKRNGKPGRRARIYIAVDKMYPAVSRHFSTVASRPDPVRVDRDVPRHTGMPLARETIFGAAMPVENGLIRSVVA
jgi:hypothetical protein